MSKGVNKVILLGNLGQDPMIRYSPQGSAMATLSIATTESWKDKTSGEKQEKTEWHRVVAFGRIAEVMGEYLKKGAQVYIEGKLQTRKWQDKDGQDKYTTEIVCFDMQMLGSRRDGAEAGGEHEQPATGSKPSAGAEAYRKASGGAAKGGNEFDGDIPL